MSQIKSSGVRQNSTTSSEANSCLLPSCTSHNNTYKSEGQEESVSEIYGEHTELEKKFIPRHSESLLLSDSFSRLGQEKRSALVYSCGTYLEFSHNISDGVVDEKGHLRLANFCKDRLCPMCSWRRSVKLFNQLSRVLDYLGNKYQYIFLTLTVRNVHGTDLSETIDRLMSSWNRFIGYKDIKTVVKGYFRALEITRNPKTGEYHPHFHCMFAVSLSYGKKEYIKQAQWLEFWRRAYRDYNITEVDIRKVYNKKRKDSEYKDAAAEAAKYSLKSNQYLFDDEKLTDEVVYYLSQSLHKRRLIAYGGVLKQAFIDLRLDDAEADTADLIHVSEEFNETVSCLIVRYGWTCGIYKIIDSRIEVKEG